MLEKAISSDSSGGAEQYNGINSFYTANMQEASLKATPIAQRHDGSSVFDVVGEFANSAVKTGIENPVNAVSQLVSGNNHLLTFAETDPHASGVKKLAGQAGVAVGAIFDWAILSRVVKQSFNEVETAAAVEGGTNKIACGIRSLVATNAPYRGLRIAATTGLINGSVLTPTQDGESAWRRLDNGLIQAGTFSAMEFVAPYINGLKFNLPGPGNLLNSAAKNALIGLSGGGVNASLKALSYGELPDPIDTAATAGSWAVGNALLGTAGSAFKSVQGAGPLDEAAASIGTAGFPGANEGPISTRGLGRPTNPQDGSNQTDVNRVAQQSGDLSSRAAAAQTGARSALGDAAAPSRERSALGEAAARKWEEGYWPDSLDPVRSQQFNLWRTKIHDDFIAGGAHPRQTAVVGAKRYVNDHGVSLYQLANGDLAVIDPLNTSLDRPWKIELNQKGLRESYDDGSVKESRVEADGRVFTTIVKPPDVPV